MRTCWSLALLCCLAAVARAALAGRLDRQVDDELRQFFVMPFMHSEELADQELCVRLATDLPTDTLRYALQHRLVD